MSIIERCSSGKDARMCLSYALFAGIRFLCLMGAFYTQEVGMKEQKPIKVLICGAGTAASDDLPA
jgi:hypothetical protein